MLDRLAQLRRQRALAQEQIDWINREIAEAESENSRKPASVLLQGVVTTPEATATPSLPSSASSSAATTSEDDDLIARYRVGPDALKNDVRKGCFIYFAAALLLLGAVVAVLYFSLRAR